MIAFGAVSFAKPDILRKKLRKKGIRTLRRYLFAAAFFIGALLISAGWGHEGALPKILTGIGVVLILKGAYLAGRYHSWRQRSHFVARGACDARRHIRIQEDRWAVRL